jgi:murein L,D-transpeptidase YcbB/YkuD
MVARPLIAVLTAVIALPVLVTAGPASAQTTKTVAAARSLDPGASEAPDPLAPPDVAKPAPAAPGAPTAPAEAKPAAETDPIVVLVRQKLAATSPPGNAGDRDDLAAAAAFYADTAAQPIWTGKDGFTPRATLAVGEVRKAEDWGLKASAFDLPILLDGAASTESLAAAEIKLSLAVLKYARHARGGRLDPTSVSRIFDQKPTIFDPRTLLPAIAAAGAADAYLRELHPRHPQFERLRQALLAARGARAEDGGVPAGKPAEAVQRLIVNMERWRWMPPELGPFYVWDSVPDQMTTVYKDGKPVLSEKIVVGKPGSPTPIFSSDMLLVIFHPSWGVPPGIKAYELLPQLKAAGGGWFFSSGASAVLKSHGLQLSRGGRPVDPDSVNWSTADVHSYDFTQPPGPKNLLGIVKFRFPNKHNVYMHDTPERHLFGGASRVFSHGCMRVQNPIRLAEVLLEHDKGWGKEKVAEYVRRGGEIKLTTPIPVHITYFTAVVDDDGKLHQRPDVYALDARVASALEGRAVHVGSTAVAAAKQPGDPEAKDRKQVKQTKSAAKERKAAAQPSFNPFGSSSRY